MKSLGAKNKDIAKPFRYGGCIILVVCMMLVAIISGYLPTRKAARMNPIDALRTE